MGNGNSEIPLTIMLDNRSLSALTTATTTTTSTTTASTLSSTSINTIMDVTQDWQDLVSINLLELSFYVFLFTIGGSANAYVVYNLAWRKRYTQTRHEKLLLNLAIADAIVTLLMTPSEIAWRITASWKAGNLMCKLFQFYRLFGIYLSSMVLICISIDRLLAVYSPFKYQTYDIFVKKLLIFAWILSFIFALPQIFVFRVESPEEYPGFTQCVSFKASTSDAQLRSYNIFCLCIIYFVPLLCISLCYTFICIKIRRKMVQRFLTVFRNGDLTTTVNPVETQTINAESSGFFNHHQHVLQRNNTQSSTNQSITSNQQQQHVVTSNGCEFVIDTENNGTGINSTSALKPAPKTNSTTTLATVKMTTTTASATATATLTTTTTATTTPPATTPITIVSTQKGSKSRFSVIKTQSTTKSVATPAGSSSTSRQRQKIGSKIVKDTVIIIATFIVCWTPYATIHLWYQIDWSSAFQVDKSLQGVLFLFAISNSCVNPFIYVSRENQVLKSNN